jgi:hypothetical protein
MYHLISFDQPINKIKVLKKITDEENKEATPFQKDLSQILSKS